MAISKSLASFFGKNSKHALSKRRFNPMSFRPLHDRVLVRRIEESETTAGGMDF